MHAANEQLFPFREPSAEKLAVSFHREFPRIIGNDQFLDHHLSSLTLSAQQVLNATDEVSLLKDGLVEESFPVEGPGETVEGDTMIVDAEGNVTGFGTAIGREKVTHQRVTTHQTSTIGASGDLTTPNEPWPIPFNDALSYLAYPDTPSIVKDTFNLPPLHRGISGFRTFLITQLCQTDDRLIAWVNTEHGNTELRKILLDAAIADKAVIDRYQLRKHALGIKDDSPITRCVTDVNASQIENLFSTFINDLTARNIPSPDAPAPTS